MKFEPGIGATQELSLRVSVATLVRVVFEHPDGGERMLALERKATLHETNVEVKSQPFGGAVRILDLDAIYDLIGDFDFDSTNSRAEQDFRLFIRPSAWPVLREFCIQHLSHVHDPVIETDPTRELTEEFADALKISLKPNQYIHTPVETVIEDHPAPTDNVYARGISTARVYRIFEASITDPSLIRTMLKNSEGMSDRDLCELAMDDFHHGGKGWANAMFALPLKQVTEHYSSLPVVERNATTVFGTKRLDETVAAVLEGITVSRYQRL
ncbi:MAG TPA: hypothetical protein VFY26_19920 [Anaerolineales bacterium]|nr:hypothetical protein [Anaerolineales bacterium]